MSFDARIVFILTKQKGCIDFYLIANIRLPKSVMIYIVDWCFIFYFGYSRFGYGRRQRQSANVRANSKPFYQFAMVFILFWRRNASTILPPENRIHHSSHAHRPIHSTAANRSVSKKECVAFKQTTAQTHTHARVAPTTVLRVVKRRHCAMSAKWYIQRENSQSIHSVFDILGQTVSCVFVHKEKYCAYDCLMTEVATILVIYIHFVSLIFRPGFPLKSNSIRFSRSNAIRCTQILVPLQLYKPRKS